MKYKKFKGEKETLCRLLGSAMYLDSSVYGGVFCGRMRELLERLRKVLKPTGGENEISY